MLFHSIWDTNGGWSPDDVEPRLPHTVHYAVIRIVLTVWLDLLPTPVVSHINCQHTEWLPVMCLDQPEWEWSAHRDMSN